MKLSIYANQMGISDCTAFHWFKRGKIRRHQMDIDMFLLTKA